MTPTATATVPAGAAERPEFASRLPFEWLLALRFLREGAVQTGLIITGIALGVAVIVFMSALLQGVQSNMLQRVLSGQPHIQLVPAKQQARPLYASSRYASQILPGHNPLIASVRQTPSQQIKGVDQWQPLLAQLQQWPDIVLVSPVVLGAGLAVRGNSSRAVTINGVQPARYFAQIALADKLIQGSSALNAEQILLGTELAAELAVTVGDKLRLHAANNHSRILTVHGIADFGNMAANSRSSFVTLRTAQSLLALPGGVSGLDIWLADVYQAAPLAQKLTALPGIDARSWTSSNAQFFVALSAQQSSNTVIRLFVGCSVALGIASVLVVVVLQKSADIGILRAIGVSRGQIMRIFLLQGALLALCGALTGLLLAALGLAGWQRLQQNPDGTALFVIQLPASLQLNTVLLAVLVGLSAALLPALRAARLDPVVAMHG